MGHDDGRQHGRAGEHEARERGKLHGRLESKPCHREAPQPCACPVLGSSIRAGVDAFQSNMWSSVPAMASKEP